MVQMRGDGGYPRMAGVEVVRRGCGTYFGRRVNGNCWQFGSQQVRNHEQKGVAVYSSEKGCRRSRGSGGVERERWGIQFWTY